MIFLYDSWNRAHVGKHGITPDDAEFVVENAAAPFPRKVEVGKYMVVGPDRAGHIIEVVFAFKIAEEIAFDAVDPIDLGEVSEKQNVVAVYIVHAQGVTGRRKKHYRRTRR